MTEITPKLSAAVRSNICKAADHLGVGAAGAGGGARVLSLLCNPHAAAIEVSGAISKEPALCVRVLKVANSPFYGLGRTVTSIDRALVVLGLSAVRGIAAAACLDRAMKNRSQRTTLNFGAVFLHSLATGAAAEALSRRLTPALASDAFIAGLLHHLGVVIQSHLSSAMVEAVLEHRRQGDNRPITELESALGMIGHEEYAAVLFDEWQLPANIISAARYHHHPPPEIESGHCDLTTVISLASRLAHYHGYPDALEGDPIHIRIHESAAWLQTDPTLITEIAAGLPARVHALCG